MKRHSFVTGAVPVFLLFLALLMRPATAQDIRLVPQTGHGNFVTGITFSEDGQTALTSGAEGTVKVWQLEKRRLLKTLYLPDHVAESATLPNGRMVAATRDKLFYIGAAQAKTQGSDTPKFEESIGQITPVPGTKTVLIHTNYDEKLFVFDVTAGKRVSEFASGKIGWVYDMAVSPDGTIAALATDKGTISLLTIATGKPLRTIKAGKATILKIGYADGGSKLVSVNADGAVRVWDTATGKEAGKLAETIKSQTLDVSPDGKMLALGDETGAIHLVDLATMKKLAVAPSDKGAKGQETTSISFNPSGDAILSGASAGTVKYWRWKDQSAPVLIGNGVDSGWDAVVSTKGSLYGLEGSAGFSFWSATSGALEPVRANRSDAPLMIGFNDTLSLCDFLAKGEVSYDRKTMMVGSCETADGLKALKHSSKVKSVALSPDGKTVATGVEDGTITLWDATTGKARGKLKKHADEVYSLAFSPDGKTLVSGSNNHEGHVLVWDVGKMKLIGRRAEVNGKPRITTVMVAPDNDLFASASGQVEAGGVLMRMAYLSKASDATFKQSVLITDPSSIKSFDFSPNGKMLMVQSLSSAIQLRHVPSGKSAGDLTKGNVISDSPVVWSSRFLDDKRILTAHTDGGARIWDAATKKMLVTSYAFDDGSWMTITPDGFMAAAGSISPKIRVTDGKNSFAIDQIFDALYRPDLVREALAGDPKGLVKEAAAKLDLKKLFGSGAPPQVSIAAPAAPAGDAPVPFTASLTDQGGGISKLEWRVNGVTQAVTETAAAGDVTQAFALEPGSNTISVTAFNGAGLIASDVAQVTLDVADTAGRKPRLFVLAIGVNDYQEESLRLKFSVNDANAVGKALGIAATGRYEEVVLQTLVDKHVTRSGLEAAFAGMAGKMTPQDSFVLYVAGHGKTEGGRYFFIPSDFRLAGDNAVTEMGVGQELLQQWLATVPARRAIVLIDTCESGTLAGETDFLVGQSAVERLQRATGRTVLTASSATEPALEGYRGHGVFTYALLDALSNGDTDGNGSVEVKEIANYVTGVLPELSRTAFGIRQVPQVSFGGQSFPIGSPVKALQ